MPAGCRGAACGGRVDDAVFEVHARMELRHWWFRGRRRILHRLLHQVLEPGHHAVVVDVGCGTGGNIGPLSGRYRCYGLDPEPFALDVARRRFPEVRFLEGTTRRLGELPEPPDAILLSDVLEHIEDDRRAYLDCVAALRPGGHLLVTVPADPKLYGPHDVSHGHHRRYSRSALVALLDEAHVQVRLLSHFNHRLYPLARAVRWLGRLRGRGVGAAGTDLRLLPEPFNGLLAALFAGEADRLAAALEDGRPGYGVGLSLLAVVRKPGDG